MLSSRWEHQTLVGICSSTRRSCFSSGGDPSSWWGAITNGDPITRESGECRRSWYRRPSGLRQYNIRTLVWREDLKRSIHWVLETQGEKTLDPDDSRVTVLIFMSAQRSKRSSLCWFPRIFIFPFHWNIKIYILCPHVWRTKQSLQLIACYKWTHCGYSIM